MSVVAKQLDVSGFKMPLGRQVGLGPGDIVVGTKKVQPSNFRPMSAVAKRLDMDQDATWYGDRSRPRPHCVRWGPSSTLPPRKGAQ